MKKIIFVCTENTCRSPMAEFILKHKLKQNGITGWAVSSAGIYAPEGEPINATAVAALKAAGIAVNNSKRAKQIKKNMVNKNTIVIAVSDTHKEYIKNLPKVYSLNDFTSGMNLPDPWGQPQVVYDRFVKIISFILDEIIEKIKKGEF